MPTSVNDIARPTELFVRKEFKGLRGDLHWVQVGWPGLCPGPTLTRPGLLRDVSTSPSSGQNTERDSQINNKKDSHITSTSVTQCLRSDRSDFAGPSWPVAGHAQHLGLPKGRPAPSRGSVPGDKVVSSHLGQNSYPMCSLSWRRPSSMYLWRQVP